MGDPLDGARTAAESALGHPVPHVLPAADGLPMVAVSVAGDPARARLAWVDPAGGEVKARVACPPGRPSRGRPVVAAVVEVEIPGGLSDRILVARLAPEASAAQPLVASDEALGPVEAGAEGLVVLRLPLGVIVMGVDALNSTGEPVGRLARAGVSELRSDGATVGGRLGATHGMSAGFGAGAWKSDLGEASFEAGFEPFLPEWLPSDFLAGRARIEPDVSYPSGPPSIVMAWSPEDNSQRVLLRQTVAPLATPPSSTQWGRQVQIGPHTAYVSGRRMGILVFEREDLAFGIQVRGMSRPDDIAVRVARSIPGS